MRRTETRSTRSSSDPASLAAPCTKEPSSGVARFQDDGERDDKWIVSTAPITLGDARRIRAFFSLYAWIKRTGRRIKGARGPTLFDGLETERAR